MIITPNMELNSWSSVGDFYNHTQLATNWSFIDLHDHSAGKGVKLTASLSIVAGTINTALFAAGSVTSSVIGNQAVETINIANQAVGTAQLANGAVTNAQLGADAVETANIATGAVGTAQIANNAVTLAQLAQGATPYRMKVISASASYTAVSGDFLIVGEAAVITFPPAVDNATVGMIAGASTLFYEFVGHLGTENFYAQGFESGVTTGVQGGPSSILIFQAIGGNWYAVQGEYDSGWVPLSTMGLLTNIDAGAGAFTPAARLIGDRLTFRGNLVNSTGGTVTAGTTIFTLPTFMRPASLMYPSVPWGPVSTAPTANAGFLIDTSGDISVFFQASGEAWPIGDYLYLDGTTVMIR